MLTTLQTFWNGPQGRGRVGVIGYKGLFYHFLDMTTAARTWDCELSTIDTALLFAGILDAKQYFDGRDPPDGADARPGRLDLLPRGLGRSRNGEPGIKMGWKPGTGFGSFGHVAATTRR